MKETLIDTNVTYSLEHAGRFILIEGVPARVCEETGEQWFSPETVERIQKSVAGEQLPEKTIETPVYRFSASSFFSRRRLAPTPPPSLENTSPGA